MRKTMQMAVQQQFASGAHGDCEAKTGPKLYFSKPESCSRSQARLSQLFHAFPQSKAHYQCENVVHNVHQTFTHTIWCYQWRGRCIHDLSVRGAGESYHQIITNHQVIQLITNLTITNQQGDFEGLMCQLGSNKRGLPQPIASPSFGVVPFNHLGIPESLLNLPTTCQSIIFLK